MTKETVRDRGSSPPALLLQGKILPSLPVVLWITLALAALWRLALAWQVMTAVGQGAGMLAVGQATVVVRWRQLDILFGWAVFILWLMMVMPAVGSSLRQARLGALFAVLAGVGVLLSALAIAWDVWNPGREAALALAGDHLGLIAALWLGAIGLAAVLLELRAVSRDVPGGQFHLLHLWRVLAAQWVLAWVAATVALQLFQRKEDLLGTESARRLLFNIPALGLLPNLLMLGGIRLWNLVARPGPQAPRLMQMPRFRAWILAMLLATAGGILLIVRPAWLGIFGGTLLLVAIVLYAVGFPPGAWRAVRSSMPRLGGLLHFASWMFFVIATALVIWERAASLSSTTSGLAYLGNSWRHLLLLAFCLWLLHGSLCGQSLLIDPHLRLGGERLLMLAAGLLVLGGGWIGIMLLGASRELGEAQVPVLRMLFWGALPETLAILAMGGLLWKGLHARRASRR